MSTFRLANHVVALVARSKIVNFMKHLANDMLAEITCRPRLKARRVDLTTTS